MTATLPPLLDRNSITRCAKNTGKSAVRERPAGFSSLLLVLLAPIALFGCSSSASGGIEPAAPGVFDDAPAGEFGEVSRLVDSFVAQRGLSGAGLIVVGRDKGILHEEYWGEFGADRISLVASASKMLSAGVVLKLDDEGLLDIDAPVASAVEWGTGNPDITPAQLLSNSSGLVGVFPDPVFRPYICQYLPLGSMQDCAESIFTTDEDDADVIPPDTAFRYGGAQWQVAGAVAEAVSGRSWAELVEDTYTRPCGLEPGTLGYNNPITQMGNGIDYPSEFLGDPSIFVPTDNPNVESGAYATPGVFAKLLLMYLRGGECGDSQPALSADAVNRMLVDRVATSYDGSAAPGVGYGMGWWIHRSSGRAYSVGAYGAVPTLRVDDGYGYYVVLEANDSTWQALAAPLDAAIESAVLGARR